MSGVSRLRVSVYLSLRCARVITPIVESVSATIDRRFDPAGRVSRDNQRANANARCNLERRAGVKTVTDSDISPDPAERRDGSAAIGRGIR